MDKEAKTILVFGATGQQGGAVASALLRDGWHVRAFAKQTDTSPPVGLEGAEMAWGDLADARSIRAALHKVYGVYVALPSSATAPQMTDDDEVRWGTSIADAAVESGAKHIVYSSSNGVGAAPTGIGHYDGKARIEAHVRDLPVITTIVRPAGFMETLMLPGSGLEQSRFSFFVRADQKIQLVAVEDIGKVVAAVFAHPERFGGEVFEIASDELTGNDIQQHLSEAAGRPIAYSRFSDDFLKTHRLLGQMAELVDAGPLAGSADLESLHDIAPGLTTFKAWLRGSGRTLFEKALHRFANYFSLILV